MQDVAGSERKRRASLATAYTRLLTLSSLAATAHGVGTGQSFRPDEWNIDWASWAQHETRRFSGPHLPPSHLPSPRSPPGNSSCPRRQSHSPSRSPSVREESRRHRVESPDNCIARASTNSSSSTTARTSDVSTPRGVRERDLNQDSPGEAIAYCIPHAT